MGPVSILFLLLAAAEAFSAPVTKVGRLRRDLRGSGGGDIGGGGGGGGGAGARGFRPMNGDSEPKRSRRRFRLCSTTDASGDQ